MARATRRIDIAEDSVQEACVAAFEQWDRDGVPSEPRAWLISVARRKAIDQLRRESRRHGKELAATLLVDADAGMGDLVELDRDARHASSTSNEDELSLLYLCCHPALSAHARIALTLRLVCGLTTREIAAAFIVPEPTMAKRLSRAKQKVREAGIVLKPPPADPDDPRTGDVLRTIYLLFSEGHRASTGDALVRPALCERAIHLARAISSRFPDNAEATGVLALLLLTDARRAARTDADGQLVVLEEQDRSLWNHAMIAEGDALLSAALSAGRPGPMQVWAAIAAYHSTVETASATDWRQISLLYSELLRYEPSPVVEANRAIAVAMAEGPAAGLTILDIIIKDPNSARGRQSMSRAPICSLGPAETNKPCTLTAPHVSSSRLSPSRPSSPAASTSSNSNNRPERSSSLGVASAFGRTPVASDYVDKSEGNEASSHRTNPRNPSSQGGSKR